ncbi:MAG: cysteine--tRNA ligase [Candidatus Taylorbacteria bacterium]|nr:cysteine--tRNA ligase [Candidatus Taylorbacteria bacterium]
MKISFFNTLTKQKEVFKPINPPQVGIYTCGPTVYSRPHIGNLRAYVFADVLRRTLEYAGYSVRHVVNITDVGHLTSDADEGEDKMSKGLRREGMEVTRENMIRLGQTYAAEFKKDLDALNILPPHEMPRASDYIKEDIELIQKIASKGYVYEISDGLYFDTAKFKPYGRLSTLSSGLSRVRSNSGKRNPKDFALWKKNVSLGWPSPLGAGFPGWHLECSAMSRRFLGEVFDIHTGGVDHIPIHHSNEIAESEAVSGKVPARYWLHCEHVISQGAKLAKSEGVLLTLDSLTRLNIPPLAYRFWLLSAHYRTRVDFTLGAVAAGGKALVRLASRLTDCREEGQPVSGYIKRFEEAAGNDLDTPAILSLIQEVLGDKELSEAEKKATVLRFDSVLGLGLHELKALFRNLLPSLIPREKLPADALKLFEERETARRNGDFVLADKLRLMLAEKDFRLEDTPAGTLIYKL